MSPRLALRRARARKAAKAAKAEHLKRLREDFQRASDAETLFMAANGWRAGWNGLELTLQLRRETEAARERLRAAQSG